MESPNNCFCGKEGSKRCSKCHLVYYCSRDCQSADFSKHKKICKAAVLSEVVEEVSPSLSGGPGGPHSPAALEIAHPEEPEGFIECTCGQPATKKCGNCRMVSYCSRECQVADFKFHKQFCKYMKEQSVPTVGEASWTEIMKLPITCYQHPWPTPPPSSPILPLEELLPFFLIMFTIYHQNALLKCISPALTVLRKRNKLSVVTAHFDMTKMNGMQTFTSFKTFNNNGNTLNQSAQEYENAKVAYLSLAFSGKCNQIVSCFGTLVLKVLNSHQLTYGGERVIGWSIQDGNLKLGYNRVVDLNAFEIKSPLVIPALTESVRDGSALPEEVTVCGLGVSGSAVHVWLTFVTESGRIFDLDLSAFQFGTMTPLPCIHPVLRAESSALDGFCNRDRISGIQLPKFRHDISQLINIHCRMLHQMRGSDCRASSELMLAGYNHTIEILLSDEMRSTMRKCAVPNGFWDYMNAIEIM
jgi:hypothetical protein